MSASSVTGSGHGAAPHFTTQNLQKTLVTPRAFHQYNYNSYTANLPITYQTTVFCLESTDGSYDINLPETNVAGKIVIFINNTTTETNNPVNINGSFFNSETESIYPGHVLQYVSDGKIWWQINAD